ncbi:hypothetical protein NPIL_296301, partial [Nephila pilipes]
MPTLSSSILNPFDIHRRDSRKQHMSHPLDVAGGQLVESQPE